MKRSRAGSGSGGDGGGAGSDRCEVRILIPSRAAGSIIGKGGTNIQKLRTENNASVRVPDCPGPERIMTIQAEEPDNVLNVIEQTLPLMVVAGGGGHDGPDPGKHQQQELRVLIHQSIVGGIIGRSGTKIKEIRESTGSQIKVYQVCAPQSTDRCVMVQGGPDKIVAAVKQVMEIVDATEVKGVVQPYDPNNFDGYYAHEYGGFGSEMDVVAGYQGAGAAGGGSVASGGGVGMMGGGRSGRSGSGYPGVDFNGYPGGSGRMGGAAGGGPHRVGYAQAGGGYGRGGRSSGSGVRSSGGGNRMFGGGGGGDLGGASSGFAAAAAAAAAAAGGDDGKVETTQVTIPKEMAGAIIGPGGARIRKIRSDSKATITIDEPLPGCGERIITISGTQRSIQMAQYLLQQSVREHDTHYGVGGGGGGGGGAPGRY